MYRRIGLLGGLMLPTLAIAQINLTPPKFDTSSDLGGVGLLQTPTARFAPEGQIAVNTNLVEPYWRTAISTQPFPWLEATLRYTSIRDRLYGPKEFSGDQAYKDKAFDIKVRLVEESAWLPQLAIGIRDIGGTGLFGGEYIVLNRRHYDLDFSLGLAWGYGGQRGDFRNPLTFISNHFNTRAVSVGQGGTVPLKAFFTGEQVSLFGGIQYQTPWPNLQLKLEYEGNDYHADPSGSPIKANSPFNVAAVYNYENWGQVSLGFERGNTLMLNLAIQGNVHQWQGFPKFDAPPEAVIPRDINPELAHYREGKRQARDPALQLKISDRLSEQGFTVSDLEIQGKKAIITASQNRYRQKARALGRASRSLANTLPPEVEEITYVDVERGLELQRTTLLRKDLEALSQYNLSSEELGRRARIEAPQPSLSRSSPIFEPSFETSWAPGMRQQIGGPDAPYFYQLYLRLLGDLRLNRHVNISGEIGINGIDNLDGLKLPSDSKLPHVRSDIKDYLKDGKNGISRLQLDYIDQFGENWFGRASAGLFEDMFGGVGGELLYRPFGKSWAVGLELNRVRQRAFDKRFSFRDYEVNTGHLDFYYQLPFYNLSSQLSIGQYLAGDRGATVTLSRRFNSGAVLGVFFTKTNVSAEQFGEGSFDKGAFVSIPMDMITFFSSRNTFGLAWRPLTRDGGQRLSQSSMLYPTVSQSGPESIFRDWSRVLD